MSTYSLPALDQVVAEVLEVLQRVDAREKLYHLHRARMVENSFYKPEGFQHSLDALLRGLMTS